MRRADAMKRADAMRRTFVMAGGGTGGHVLPAVAVARELRKRGHDVVFVGTRAGLEAKLVPAAGFEMEWIEIGGLNRVGLSQALRSMWQLPVSTARATSLLGKRRTAAVFSMGGYVAGPVVIAAWLKRLPMVLMEPNAIPGMVNRRIGRIVKKALVSFEETTKYFPGKAEVTGVPVRPEFFNVPDKPAGDTLTVLITGGSRGSRTLNSAARESWRLFREAGVPVRILHQTGQPQYEELAREFAASGVDGKITPFIDDMPAAFAAADIIICRSGASAVAEIAASGRPAIFVPFPFAADNHQFRNAEVLAGAGAARLVADKDFTGRRLFDEITGMSAGRVQLKEMGDKARRFARPRAAERAADLLEELAG